MLTGNTVAIEEKSFKRILTQIVALPLLMAAVTAVMFVGIIYYLLITLDWAQHTNRVIVQANRPLALTNNLEAGMSSYLLSGDEIQLEPYNKARATFLVELRELINMVPDHPAQAQKLKRVEELYDDWADYAAEAVKLRKSKGDYVTAATSGKGKHLIEAMRSEIEDFLLVEREERQQRLHASDRTALITALASFVLSLFSGGVIAYFVRKRMMFVSKGYSDALAVRSRQQEVLEYQNWLQTCRGLVGDAVAGDQTEQEVCAAVVKVAARHMGATVGAMYLADSELALECKASYGINARESDARKRLRRGETLVGQAVAENCSMLLDQLPPDYLHVSTGLGEAPVRSVLIVPVSNHDKILAAMEFGFLHTASSRERDFLESVAENIGLALQSARFKQRLQHALEDSQSLNEELQAQQEELRSTNEELEQQSDALLTSQAMLESHQEELRQANHYLERQTQELKQQKNALDDRNIALASAQIELEQRAMEIERASRYKSEFLANMSHELRTPLNSTLILSRLLADNSRSNLTPDQVQYAESIYSAGNELLFLINDVLDLSKVEAGMLKVEAAPIALQPMLESLHLSFQPFALEKKLAFEIDAAPGLPDLISSDEQRLQQILKNLLSNAFKYTERGHVALAVASKDGTHVTFTVSDSGIGIPESQQEIIFEAFRQAEGMAQRNMGGTGLGLAISRNLAALLGGSIALKSEPGKGSTFTLTLPFSMNEATGAKEASLPAPVQRAQASEVSAPRVQPLSDDRGKVGDRRTVLVIEDDPAFCLALYELAHEAGFACLVALSADEGFLMAREHKPDAILLDMKLPDTSGMVTLERLKADPDMRHIPVHVISGIDRSKTALHMGAIGYLIKPVEKQRLQQTFRQLESRLSQRIKRVLIVENDQRQQDSIRDLISGDDIEIILASCAQEAIAALRETVFDCMIIDLNLPDMRGQDMLEKMLEGNIGSFPPVIVYTGQALTLEEEQQLQRYSNSIIIKGAHSPERLLDEVTLFLHQVEANLAPARRKMLQEARNRDSEFRGLKVLLVDDDIRNVFALNSAMEEKGMDVRIGRNGLEALAALENEPDIDMVLMDMMMPEMDGYEAIRRIRDQLRFVRLPVIAVTAKAMPVDHSRCLQAGASDYIAKPLMLEQLFSLMHVWMPSKTRFLYEHGH